MPFAKSVINIRQFEIDRGQLTGNKGFGLFKAVPELAAKRLSPQ